MPVNSRETESSVGHLHTCGPGLAVPPVRPLFPGKERRLCRPHYRLKENRPLYTVSTVCSLTVLPCVGHADVEKNFNLECISPQQHSPTPALTDTDSSCPQMAHRRIFFLVVIVFFLTPNYL